MELTLVPVSRMGHEWSKLINNESHSSGFHDGSGGGVKTYFALRRTQGVNVNQSPDPEQEAWNLLYVKSKTNNSRNLKSK